MKRGIRVLLIAAGVVAALLIVMVIGATAGMGAVRRTRVNPVDLQQIADGVYGGSFRKGRFAYGVEVTVRDHRIVSADSTDRLQPQEAVVREILARVVERQSVALDTVSGATLTTRAVTKAVENALVTGD